MNITMMGFFKLLMLTMASLFIFSCKGASGGYAPAPNATPTPSAVLKISPATATLAVTNLQTFRATGGIAPYRYSVFTGSGAVLATTGSFIAPGSPGFTTVRVTDSLGAFADAIVTTNAALQISPVTQSLGVNALQTFTASGGAPPYVYYLVSGTGTIDSVGAYVAPASPGTDMVRVQDQQGNTADATVSIFAALGIAPTYATIAVNNTTTFTAAGGTGPYTFSLVAGTGTVNASTGVYTAPAVAGSATVRVTDNVGAVANATVTVNAGLTISPTSQTTYANSLITFTAAGGVTPYTFSVVSGTGTMNASSGDYTAPAVNGVDTVRVTDAYGNFVNAVVTTTTPISISPTTITIAVNNTTPYTASGGTGPFTFSRFSGTGSVNASAGVYTASAAAGSATVRVTDSLGAFADGLVTVNAALAISPLAQIVLVNSVTNFSATGGVAPYTFSLLSGAGSIDINTGAYTAPAINGSAMILVTDLLGNTASTNITTTTPMSTAPTSITLAVNNTQTFTVTGGTGPFTFSVPVGTGTVNAASGVYTAPSASGTGTVRVTDSLGATANASVTINSALAISPASQTVGINGTFSFSSTGGVLPNTYSIFSGGGSINAATGAYTAPAGAGSAVVRVTDSYGNFSSSNVTITSGLSISPASKTLAVTNTATFTGANGTTPYTYSIFAGGGTINSATGLYTAPAGAGTATVRVTDNLGITANSAVIINAALAIAPATKTLAVNNVFTFSATGGVSPYTYSIFAGGGTINSSTGSYTAPASAGSATVRVTDSYGNISNATVTINAALAIAPASVTVNINGTQTFAASGGVSPYTYSIVAGTGAVVAATGAYTAPAANGSATVRVTDSLGNIANAAVTITTPMNISPTPRTLAVNNTQTFTVSGGTGPYSYSVFAGTGTVVSSAGVYTAPAASGTATVRVTDSLGAVSDAAVTVNAALAISPATGTIASTSTQQYNVTGGVAPMTYSIVSGPGTINASTGLYSGVSAGTVTVRATDSLGNFSDASLTVNGPLSVTPTTAYVVVNSDLVLSAIGGVTPYTFSIVVGGGIIDAVTGIYTAPATTGTATLRTTDSSTPTAATVDTAVTIYNALTLSPLSVTMGINATQAFTTTGGVGTKTFSVYSGTGTINSTTGVFTAPAIAGVNLIHVSDTIGNVVEASVNVVSSLTISPQTLKLPVFSTATFTSTLGTSPYVYSVFAGTGTINSSTGVYTAPSAASVGTVRSTDAISNFSNAAVTHIEPVEIASGTYHSCVRYNEGSVKCFGLGSSGQLANGGTTNLADAAGTLGANIPFIALGTGRTATKIAAGYTHSCALLDNASIKCWGQNTYGELGIGNTTNMGSAANQMGDSLPAVNLGVGRTALNVYAFGYTTCAILDNGVGKCWGRNSTGQLGKDDVVNRGTAASQMGDNLLAINLGASLTPTKFVGGLDFTCALLSNASVKCFGSNRYGQLGQGSTISLGDNAGEMAALASINLGTGRTAVDIGAGISHACAILDNGTAKCWGRNNKGQAAAESANNTIGASAGQMGDSLLASPFPGAFVPAKVSGGNTSTCFMNAAGAVRCFGLGTTGQLLLGSIANTGRTNGDVSGSVNVNMGTGIAATSLGAGYYTNCVITNTKRIKCWGSSLSGATGNGQTANNLGDVVGELGDSLPFVNN